MSRKEFKLSRTLYGHFLDVRSIAVTPNNDIISGSRDMTAKFWKYNPFQNNFEEVMTYRDQGSFVACVLFLNPTEEFPDGLVVTGGNDNMILVYKPSELSAIFSIKEHTDTVSSLAKANEANAFFTGSWDKSAKYIKISGTPKCITTFKGHTAAVWGVVQLKDSRIITASADKTLIMWNSDGQKLQSLKGHSDCVRAVIDITDLEVFLSASNDATIKVWSYTGENLNTYVGHGSYIYSIAKCKDRSFVSSDEDRSVRYWENGENIQTITLPAQSIWSVACLHNGDIVTGSSDGVIRVFTQDEARYADEAALTKFAEEVQSLQQQSMQEIGGVKVSDLPGREALYNPGKRSGQMLMIRDEGKVLAYTWVSDGDNSHWEKVGDVMGGTDKDSSGKTVFEGKSYDFVFSVDVEEGKPPLKLPYNKGDDVYQAANNFLTKNFLPAGYLEQVVDFILKNSKEQCIPPTNNAYQDPFTGGSRYTPSYQANSAQLGINVDPFTGGSSYATSVPKPTTSSEPSIEGNADPSTGSSSDTTTSQGNSDMAYFPISSYRTFEFGVPEVILKKLMEFNALLEENNKVSEQDLKTVVELCNASSEDPIAYELLFTLLEWPENRIFPVLDVVRMAVRNQTNNEIISTLYHGDVLNKLQKYIGPTSKGANSTIVALRALCNLCIYEAGEDLIFQNKYDIVENVISLGPLTQNGQVALATCLMNLTVMSVKKRDDLSFMVLAQVLPDIATKLSGSEAHFRIYVAIGTLVQKCNSHRSAVVNRINEDEDFLTMLHKHIVISLEPKRSYCAKQLRNLLEAHVSIS